jgi:hypothetical protein
VDPSYVVSVKLDEASDVRNYGKMSVVETVLETNYIAWIHLFST